MHIAIIGFGLIGASAAKAWRAAYDAQPALGVLTLTAMDRHAPTLAYAREHQLVDEVTDSIEVAVRDADMIVVAVPPGVVRGVFRDISLYAKTNAIVSDVASVRAPVVAAAMRSLRPDLLTHYVPLHPIAGSEKSGVEAARTTLFQGAAAVLTPLDGTDPGAIATVSQLWELTGARIVTMSPDTHDRVYALVSHAPHLLAYAMMRAAITSDVGAEALKAAGGGFRDFTRIAQADPWLWKDIFIANRRALLDTLDAFEGALAQLREAVETEDVSHMVALLSEARDARAAMAKLLPPNPTEEKPKA